MTELVADTCIGRCSTPAAHASRADPPPPFLPASFPPAPPPPRQADPSELNNLNRGDGVAKYAGVVASMTARLMDASRDAAPYSDIVPPATWKTVFSPLMCDLRKETGFWLPVDFDGRPIPNPPPAPAACTNATINAVCPLASFKTEKECRSCCNDHHGDVLAVCKPKQFNAYCEQIGPSPPAPPGPTPPGTCAEAAKQACPGPFDDPSECDLCVRKSPTAGAACSHEERKAYCGG